MPESREINKLDPGIRRGDDLFRVSLEFSCGLRVAINFTGVRYVSHLAQARRCGCCSDIL
jgi:hypothetical protein